MSHSHPHHNPNPGTAGASTDFVVDVVAGEPPVPISLWRTATSEGDQPGRIGARLATAIVTSYTAVADTVLDLTGSPTFLHDACDAAGRRYERLEQPHHESQVALVIADQPQPGDCSSRTAAILAIATARLRPGGCLILVDHPTAPPADHRSLHASASAVGLDYFQHIVTIAADVDGDRFVYYPSPEELAAATDPAGSGHVRVHRDLRVYVAHGTTMGGAHA